MVSVRVVDVPDGNTIAVNPPWQLGSNQGNLIRIKGMAAAALDVPQGQIARCKLTLLLLGSCVLIFPTSVIDGRALVCEVYYQGRALNAHFPEHAERAPLCEATGTD